MFASFVQVTFPPTWMVSSFGLNVKLPVIEMGLVSEGVVLPPLLFGLDIRTTATITTAIKMMTASIVRFLVSFIAISVVSRAIYTFPIYLIRPYCSSLAVIISLTTGVGIRISGKVSLSLTHNRSTGEWIGGIA